MEKGISGHLMAAILVIITGIVAVILFFIFSTKAGESIQEGFSQLRERFAQAICDMIPGGIKWIVGC
ncbi:MAG: hypothetical protein QXI58_06060 [Candidatus Micrarchaeia archaeon]